MTAHNLWKITNALVVITWSAVLLLATVAALSYLLDIDIVVLQALVLQ